MNCYFLTCAVFLITKVCIVFEFANRLIIISDDDGKGNTLST